LSRQKEEEEELPLAGRRWGRQRSTVRRDGAGSRAWVQTAFCFSYSSQKITSTILSILDKFRVLKKMARLHPDMRSRDAVSTLAAGNGHEAVEHGFMAKPSGAAP